MPYHHTELIRLLEQRGYIFPSDPASITEILRQADGTPEAKLHRRAQLIDRDQTIAQRLAQYQQRLRFARRVACAAWFIIGLLGTYQLMQQSSLNFMLILVGILGGNSLMLIIWLISLTQKYRAPTSIPLWLTGSLKDPIHQALLEHDAQTAAQPPFRWIRGRISHQLALCGLAGMFTASLMLLTVRQYQFNWQSTLLSDQHFAQIIRALAWLPARLGFPTPTPDIIAAARNHYHSEHAAAWGILLLGSILCYGIAPRLGDRGRLRPHPRLRRPGRSRGGDRRPRPDRSARPGRRSPRSARRGRPRRSLGPGTGSDGARRLSAAPRTGRARRVLTRLAPSEP